nr:hypothetical protein BaRGS_019364 [Batillaria attramentaria]
MTDDGIGPEERFRVNNMGCLSSKGSSPPANHAEINPSLKPPKRKRCRLITDPTVFKDTDNRARKQFSATVKPENAALKVGLQFLTHTRTVINVKNDVTVKVKVKSGRSPLESVTAYLAPPDSPNKEDRSGVVTSLKDDGTCSVYVRPPANGKYLLFVTYVIECHRQKPVQHPFPDKSGMWGRLYPMATECGLKKTKNAPVQFETRTEDGAIITARLPRAGYYLLRVFASHPDSAKTLQQAADLLLYSSKDIKDCPQFPQAYTFAHTHKVRLLQPQSSTVAQGVKTVYRIHAPTLAKVKVAGTEMTLKRNAWEAEVTPKPGDREISIYGAIDKQARTLNGLYKFEVVIMRTVDDLHGLQ